VVATVSFAVVALLVGGDLFGGIAEEPMEPTDLRETSATEFVVLVARTPGGSREWTNFTRVIGYLSEEVARPVSVRYVPHEDEAGEILRAEEADVAFLCAHMYMDLRDAGLVEGIAVPVVDGQAETTMRLVTDPSSGIEDFEDLRGRTVAVSDKSSLGGQAYLLWLCGERKVTPEAFFGEIRTGETMEENVGAVLAGDADATIVNRVQLSAEKAAQLRVIEESPPYGSPPVVVSTRLDAETRNRVRDALLGFDPTGVLPEDSRIDGFVPVSEVSYAFEDILRIQCESHGHIR
jgi:phosphonate transport system substrate-binding protein